MLRDFCVKPVAIDSFWGYDQKPVELALVVKHGHVVDQHETFARAHVSEKGGGMVIPEALKVGLLVYKWLVFKGVGR
jgi:hypothetical protein